MDDIDIKLLGELFQSMSKFGAPRKIKGSFKTIAQKLGFDEDTVRKRIKALQGVGLLKGWQLYLSPSVLGCGMFGLWVNVDSGLPKDDVIRRIGMVHGVLGITDMVSKTIAVQLLCKTEQSFRKSADLILELSNGKILFSYNIRRPESNLHLSPKDWDVVRTLRRKPTSSYSELGKTMGLSSRAAKRRLERLISERIVTIVPGIDFKAMRGAIGADMIVTYADPSFKNALDMKIASRLGHYLFRGGWGDETHGHFTFGVPGIAAARETGDWVGTLGGVVAFKLDFIYEFIPLLDAYDELIPS